MSEQDNEIYHCVVLKGVAVSGAGLLADGSFLTSCSGEMTSGPVEVLAANEAWYSQRVWPLSGNNVVTTSGGTPATTTRASRIYRPRSAQEIAEVVKSLPATTPIAFDDCHCQAEICVKAMSRARDLRATLRCATVDALEVRR
jgi:hypothetical protein